MPHLQFLWPHSNAIILCIPTLLFLVGAIGGRLASMRKISLSQAWRLARITSAISVLSSLAFFSDALLHWALLERGPRIDTLISLGAVHLSFRFDMIESLMLLLVTFLGWVIVNYSSTYMAGDSKEPSYIDHLMRTLTAVSLLVVTNNLLIFLAAWILTSLSLHGLLTHYPNRQAAVIAAHKKFIASRLGDLTLLSSVFLLGTESGSFEITEVINHVVTLHQLPASVRIAALLLAVSAMIKCAQLPLHGWLIQVMEAPTPVSALLHAGVVNLGGFMLIRLAPVINTTSAAEGFLVVIGCLTAVVASLVMTTRISIKVHLAWSTCAQMGFMLMECGLGLYDLAFLHLLAHSLYKAHAFLGSGGTVGQAMLKRMAPPEPKLGFIHLLGSGISGLLIAGIAAILWQQGAGMDMATFLCILIVGIAVSGILISVASMHTVRAGLILATSALGISTLYFGYEMLFRRIVPATVIDLGLQHTLLIFSAICFALLYVIQMMVRVNPLGQFAKVLYPWFYAGFYLDEIFTRATFRLWPANHISAISARRDVAFSFEEGGISL